MPFYNGSDSKLYGVSTIDLAKGKFGYSNELLSETGKLELTIFLRVKLLFSF